MKPTMCLFVCLLMGQISFCQNLSPDSVKLKHEIAIGISPLFQSLRAEYSPSSLFACYKRNGDKLKFRIGASVSDSKYHEDGKQYHQISLDDSLIILTEKIRTVNKNFIQVGIEKTKTGKFFEISGGVDIVAGVGTKSTKNANSYFPLSSNNVYTLKNKFPIEDSEQSNDYVNVGISPFIAADVRLNELLSVGILVPVYIYYSHSLEKEPTVFSGNTLEFDEIIRITLTATF